MPHHVTNADDLGDWRPGLEAAREHGVVHPLIELPKARVRELAEALGVPSARKPASPCLASRIPYGTAVTPDVPGARRFERDPIEGTNTILTWYEVFPGGCATVRLSSRTDAPEVVDDVTEHAGRVIGFVTRDDLAHVLDAR